MRTARRARLAADRVLEASPRPDGLVLAGGRSRRFGADKRLAKLDGDELVRRAVRTVRRAAGGGVVYVATGVRRERLPGTAGTIVLADEPPGCGPLGGLAAALGRSRTGIVVLGCDLPLVRAATLARVARAGIVAGRPAAAYGANGWEPLVAYWPRAVYNQLRAALGCRQLALHELLERLGAVAVMGVEPAELCNVNTRADLETAARATAKKPKK